MKTQLIILFIFISQIIFAQTAKLNIIINNIESVRGNLEIGIYNTPKSFPKKNEEYKTISHPIKSKTEKIDIILPQGEYAVAVFHDKDANGVCNRNLLRIPTEAYGFSNNVKPRFSAPSFNQAKFRLDKNKTIIINLIL